MTESDTEHKFSKSKLHDRVQDLAPFLPSFPPRPASECSWGHLLCKSATVTALQWLGLTYP